MSLFIAPIIILKGILVLLPWHLKRPLLQLFFKFELSPSARIGFSWIYPKRLCLKSGSSIGSMCVAVNLELIQLGEYSSIGRGNWITGFPIGTNSYHFSHQSNRKPELIVGNHSAISKNHHIDCTNSIRIGSYTTIAGYGSQFLTHSINLYTNKQDSWPITIGSYCFVGTSCVVVGGAILPDYSVLGASSLLNKQYAEDWTLYAGVPARPIKSIDRDSLYFTCTVGYVI